MTVKKASKETKTKGVLVRILPSVYDECMEYNLNIPLIMRRALLTELTTYKQKIGNAPNKVNMALYQAYDDKTMTFKERA